MSNNLTLAIQAYKQIGVKEAEKEMWARILNKRMGRLTAEEVSEYFIETSKIPTPTPEDFI